MDEHNDMLSSREPKRYRPPLHVRWWNLALVGILAVAAVSVVAPLRNSAYRQGFIGNLVSSAWQLIAGAVVAWVVLNRFKAERLHRTISFSWDGPFREMNKIALGLSDRAVEMPIDFRNALSPKLRNRLRLIAASAQRKGALYGRFFEIEQLAQIDKACEAAEDLAELDDQLPDSEFMVAGIRGVRTLHFASRNVCGLPTKMEFFEGLRAAEERWRSY
jgi:hypothetical protein